MEVKQKQFVKQDESVKFFRITIITDPHPYLILILI